MGLDEKRVKGDRTGAKPGKAGFNIEVTEEALNKAIEIIDKAKQNEEYGRLIASMEKRIRKLGRLGKKEEYIIIFADVVDKVIKNSMYYATEDAFKALTSILENKNFSEDLFPLLKKIAENTEDYATEYAFKALNSILNNPSFKKEWLTEDLGIRLSEICSVIVKNTEGGATENAFNALYSVLENKSFSKELFPILQKIAENTSEGATEYAFYALNSLISKEDFNIDWISKYWNPIFNAIVKNTEGGATENAFWALNSLISKEDFNLGWIDKYWNPIFNAIVKNTEGGATENAFYDLYFILENKDFSEDLLPILQKIAEHIKGRQLATTLELLNETLNESLTQEAQLIALALKTCNWKIITLNIWD